MSTLDCGFRGRLPHSRLELADWIEPLQAQCAWRAVRKQGGSLQGLFRRLWSGRSEKTAIVAVAAAILTSAYHMLRNHTPYRDPGPQGFIARDKAKLAATLARRVRNLGYRIDLAAATCFAPHHPT